MKTFLTPLPALLLITALTPACDPTPPGRALDEDERGSAAFCVEPGSAAAEGMLALVNDEAVSLELLDAAAASGGVGLYRNAAIGIADARPFTSIEQLDAVPYVGRAACEALAKYACNEAGRCRAPVSMMSWNIEHFPMTEDTQAAVVELVEELRPDVIGVQEIQNRDAFWDMVDQLDGYEGIVGQRGYFTRVGMLVRSDVVEVLETEDLFVDDAYTFPRSVLAARLRLREALRPTTLDFAVVHLKAFGDAESVQRRRSAVEQLRGWVDERRSAGEGEVVIVGDWNDRLTDDEDDNVFLPLSEDAAEAEFVTLELAEAGDSSYVPFPSLIDHILVTDEVFEGMTYQTTEVLRLDETWSSTYEKVVSDHRPVRASFELAVGWAP